MVCLLLLATPAKGSVLVGQLDPGTPGIDCQSSSGWVQSAEAAGASYVVPAGRWVVISWSHRADSTTGRQLALRLWRPGATASSYTLVGAAALRTLTPGGINSFQERIPVSGGDRLGLRVGNPPAGGASCTFTTASATDAVRYGWAVTEPPLGAAHTLSGQQTSRRLNVTARLEADADADGYGDETQDSCPGAAGPSNGCPYPAPPPADTTRPTVKLRVRRDSIRDGHVGVWVTVSEAVRVTGRGSVRIASRKRRQRLRRGVANATEPRTVRLSLQMQARTRRAARRALRRGKRVRARISIAVRDAAGNATSAKTTVRLKL